MQPQTKNLWVYGIIWALVLVMAIFQVSCAKQEDAKLKAQENTPKSPPATQQVSPQSKASIATQRLSQALSDGKHVYLFFYEPGNIGCETMEGNIDSFAKKTNINVEIIKVDRKDPDNSDIVTRLRTQTAPIPLTLLFAPTGDILATFTKVVTEQELMQAFPSPKKVEALKYIQEGKGVILCFASEKMPARVKVQARCSQAIDQLAGKAKYISIDLSDPKEASLIKELRIAPNQSEPVTFVINSQSQVTGKYNGEVQVANLIEAATKVVKSGCCPPSSGKTCGPTQTK